MSRIAQPEDYDAAGLIDGFFSPSPCQGCGIPLVAVGYCPDCRLAGALADGDGAPPSADTIDLPDTPDADRPCPRCGGELYFSFRLEGRWDRWVCVSCRRDWPIVKPAEPDVWRDTWSVAPACPDCGSAMRLRRRRKDGRAFLGCSGYPACSRIEDFH